ncbi:MAG TPA: DUF1254 domain-containing protein [Kofleriaceae bacterium]|nr:DUF1254 domain-containing protein [Kofleriaceae bacterium]
MTHRAALANIDDLIRTADPGALWEEANAYSLGIQAYIWGFPWIYLSQLAWLWTSPEGKAITGGKTPWAPMNSFWRASQVAAPGSATGGSPNADTLYATAWLDLSREPLVLSVPEVTDRFYNVEMASIDSDNFAYVGTAATGTAAGDYLIAGPGWTGQAPANVLDVLPRSRTPVVFMLCRTEVLGQSDLPAALAIQQGYQLTPLSRWLDANLPPEQPPKAMVPTGFDYNDTSGAWLTMNDAMTYNPPGVPPGIDQRSLIELFATIGIGPGQHLADQSEATLRGLQRAAADGLALLKQMASGRGKQVNGWTYPPLDTGRAGQAGDYITRSAIQALGGIVANDPDESVYLNASVDAKGVPLGAGRYAITFPTTASMPPVLSEYHGFWSITVYDAATYDFIPNTTNYTINSHDPQYQTQRPEGGIQILIQPDPPQLSPGVYWLQTAKPGSAASAFYLVLRVYAPAPPVSATQTWSPPLIERVG